MGWVEPGVRWEELGVRWAGLEVCDPDPNAVESSSTRERAETAEAPEPDEEILP